MVFEKKQLSKALAIVLMVACAVAFMPLLNGQAFAAAKKPAKVKSLKAAQVADTMTAKATWKKGKNCKKYNVKVDGVLVAKKQKAKSYTTEALTEGVHKIAVAGVNGKKVGKYKTVKVEIKAPTPPTPTQLEVTGVVQSGVKQLKVTFSQAVDPSALVFTVTKDGKAVTATAKADPNDPNSVLLDLDSTIIDGAKYDVAVKTSTGTAVPTAAGASTEVSGEKEQITDIVIDENLVLDARDTSTTVTATVTYQIFNQFKEDVTAKINKSDLNVSSTIGSQAVIKDAGVIEVSGIQAIQQIAGTEGSIIVVYTATGLNKTQTVKVGDPAKISAVAVKGVYDVKKGTETAIIAKDAKGNKGKVLAFELKDQYDRAWTGDVEASGEKKNITVNLIGGLTGLGDYTLGDVTIDDVEYPAVVPTEPSLATVAAGEARLLIVADATGAKDDYTFVVGDENIIAGLTITAPSQVVGGYDENEFTVEATNAAGEAITDADRLISGIKLPGTAYAGGSYDAGTGWWYWEKQKDGTAKLFLEANENTTDYPMPAIAIFSGADNPALVKTVAFDILPGYMLPTTIQDIKTVSKGNAIVKINGLKVVDTFGNEVKDLSGYYATIIQSDYNEEKSTAVLMDGNDKPVGKTEQAKAFKATTLTDYYVEYTDKTEVAAASARVVVALYKDADKKTKIDDYGKTISVASDGLIDYDEYVVEVEDVYGNAPETIYLGTAKKDKDGEAVWDDEPFETVFDVVVYGVLNGTKFTIPDGDYVLSDSAKMLKDGWLVIDPQDALDAVAEDVISLKVSTDGTKVVDTDLVSFSQEAPVATTFAYAENKKDVSLVAYEDNLNAAQIDNALEQATFEAAFEVEEPYALGIMDQYGLPFGFNDVIPTVTVDKDALEDKGYTVKYNGGKEFELFVPDEFAGDYIYPVTVDYDGVAGTIDLTVIPTEKVAVILNENVNGNTNLGDLISAVTVDGTVIDRADYDEYIDVAWYSGQTYEATQSDDTLNTTAITGTLNDASMDTPERMTARNAYAQITAKEGCTLLNETTTMDETTDILTQYYKGEGSGWNRTWTLTVDE